MVSKQPEHLILASASPRRRELLEQMGLHFKVKASAVEEDDSGKDGPQAMVLNNAQIKAESVAREFPQALVLGSDTTVALGETVLSKPPHLEGAKQMLRSLSGREHTVHTAVALRWKEGDLALEWVEASQVRFKNLSEATIERYFEQVNPLDKAGAYGIQACRDLIIDGVEGSVENVMGLPIQSLAAKLLELGFDFKDEM